MGVPAAEAAAQTVGIINCAAYSRGLRVEDVTLDSIADSLHRSDRFVWLGLFEPDRELLSRIQREFHLHDLAIEDAYNAHQRPKVEQYENSLFVVLRTAQTTGTPPHIEFGETHVFVGRNYVVTVRHGYVRYALMDFVVDQYLPIVQTIEEQVEHIEDTMLDGASQVDSTTQIYRLKRDLLGLRRAVSPLVEVCNRLMRSDNALIPDDTRPYFRDVYDHVIRLNETIDAQRELLTTALEANLSLMTMSQNEHMKRLAAWAAMIAVPTMIAGIYGMNFHHMPELGWQYGYYVSLGTMVAACAGLYVGFKRSGWL
jgi:magnesium transporter